jgi:hypothetical protein
MANVTVNGNKSSRTWTRQTLNNKNSTCRDLRDALDRAFMVLVHYKATLPLLWVPSRTPLARTHSDRIMGKKQF